VHNFVLNSDSYTGTMVHNYYLAENDGKLSMIAWEYNLAFGGFGGMGGGMGGSGGATESVNSPIDTPLSGASNEDRPMIGALLSNETYLSRYHEIFAEFVEYFDSGQFAQMFDNAVALISPYVDKDPTKFCTYEEFLTGSSTLRKYCLLRAESVAGQLAGTIGSTTEAQTENGNAGFVDASDIDMSAMGSNSMGFGRARGTNR